MSQFNLIPGSSFLDPYTNVKGKTSCSVSLLWKDFLQDTPILISGKDKNRSSS